jgi:phage terminase large subunit-like protein
MTTLDQTDRELDELLRGTTLEQQQAIFYDWDIWGRDSQFQPAGDDWDVWFIRAGRGWGKTRTGAETVRRWVEREGAQRIALIAPTAADVRDTMMEGESGLLSIFPPHQRPVWQPSTRTVTFHTGAQAHTFSAEEPERLRGPQFDRAWVDEPASMRRGKDAWTNLRFGLRLGRPRTIVTGTPKLRPWLREIEGRRRTILTRGSLYENRDNLAPEYIQEILDTMEGTRLGLQEIHGEYLDTVEGALWTEVIIDDTRLVTTLDGATVDAQTVLSDLPWRLLNLWLYQGGIKMFPDSEKRRTWTVIVAVDPPGETAECGIVVVAAPTNGRAGTDHAFVLADYSLAGRPEEWGAQVVKAYREWNCSYALVEKNQGGDMVRSTIHAVDNTVRVKKLTASQSKQDRAMPVSALYEKGYVHHVGRFPLLEAQMCTWVPVEEDGRKSASPDRIDALVHGVTELLPAKAARTGRTASPVGKTLAR